MRFGEETHLPGKRKIQIEKPAPRSVARLIVDKTIWANEPPGMSAVYLFELLIHCSASREVATEEKLGPNGEKVNKNIHRLRRSRQSGAGAGVRSGCQFRILCSSKLLTRN